MKTTSDILGILYYSTLIYIILVMRFNSSIITLQWTAIKTSRSNKINNSGVKSNIFLFILKYWAAFTLIVQINFTIMIVAHHLSIFSLLSLFLLKFRWTEMDNPDDYIKPILWISFFKNIFFSYELLRTYSEQKFSTCTIC